MRKIPSLMSTQHPDCANLPGFVKGESFTNEEEVLEALHAFKMGCDEQLWDWEGKDVDTHVVRKLLSLDEDFFRRNILGESIFITYRIPNPEVEGSEKKLVVEALESIPRNFDTARKFYGSDVYPIAEVVVPMTSSHAQLLRIASYYEDIVVNKENIRLHGGIKVKDWIGEFYPKSIGVIPLVEDVKGILETEKILEGFLRNKNPEYIRPWIARSDTALNYGMVPSTLLVKFFLSAVRASQSATGVPHYPILATGSLPFRGGLNPDNTENFLEEYDGFNTYALQSSAKYDFEAVKTQRMIGGIKNHPQRAFAELPEDRKKVLLGFVDKFSSDYRIVVEDLAGIINEISQMVPDRRTRSLHMGLFGYNRNFSRKTRLPRAIKFAAALYSIGIPPEIIGIRCLKKIEKGGDGKELGGLYLNLKSDLETASRFISKMSLKTLADNKTIGGGALGMINEDIETVESLGIETGPKTAEEERHEFLAGQIASETGNPKNTERIIEAAKIRRSLG